MSKKINNLIIGILSAVVFSTGVGVTVINYCCSDCKVDTFFVDRTLCCSMHHSFDAEGKSCCVKNDTPSACNGCEEDDHCSAKRYAIDIDSSVFRPHLNIPFDWLDVADIHSHTVFCCVQKCANSCEHLGESPPINPRSYLSFIRVLII